MGKENRKIAIINQAANYLTIGLANAFAHRFDQVVLITGSVHVQGEELQPAVKVVKIKQWVERPSWKKALAYMFGMGQMWLLLLTRFRKHEVFFVSLPPMAYLLNLVLPHRFSMLIWDVYPDAFKVTGMQETSPLFRVWRWLNKKSFGRAFRLFTISPKMADLLAKYIDKNKIIVQPIWSIFQNNNTVSQENNPFVQKYNLQHKFVVQYSGNIGLAHPAEIMVDLAEQLKEQSSIVFQIIGRGPRVPALQQLVKERSLDNCVFLPFQSDEMFPYSLSAADVGVVVLNKAVAKGSVPSKSYNLMSFGIPAAYFASSDSELYDYCQQYEHAKCFSLEELAKVSEYILELKNNKEFYSRLSRNNLEAAKNFKRSNADKLVEAYLQN